MTFMIICTPWCSNHLSMISYLVILHYDSSITNHRYDSQDRTIISWNDFKDTISCFHDSRYNRLDILSWVNMNLIHLGMISRILSLVSMIRWIIGYLVSDIPTTHDSSFRCFYLDRFYLSSIYLWNPYNHLSITLDSMLSFCFYLDSLYLYRRCYHVLSILIHESSIRYNTLINSFGYHLYLSLVSIFDILVSKTYRLYLDSTDPSLVSMNHLQPSWYILPNIISIMGHNDAIMYSWHSFMDPRYSW